jgi:hypothetical protein
VVGQEAADTNPQSFRAAMAAAVAMSMGRILAAPGLHWATSTLGFRAETVALLSVEMTELAVEAEATKPVAQEISAWGARAEMVRRLLSLEPRSREAVAVVGRGARALVGQAVPVEELPEPHLVEHQQRLLLTPGAALVGQAEALVLVAQEL